MCVKKILQIRMGSLINSDIYELKGYIISFGFRFFACFMFFERIN